MNLRGCSDLSWLAWYFRNSLSAISISSSSVLRGWLSRRWLPRLKLFRDRKNRHRTDQQCFLQMKLLDSVWYVNGVSDSLDWIMMRSLFYMVVISIFNQFLKCLFYFYKSLFSTISGRVWIKWNNCFGWPVNNHLYNYKAVTFVTCW